MGAKSVYVRGEGGSIFKLDLPLHETIEDKIVKGVMQRVNADGTPYAGGSDGVAAPPTSAPAKSAAKGDWVAWAVVCGATPDDAAALSKQDLVDAYAQAPPAPPASPADGDSGDGSGDDAGDGDAK